MQGEWERRTEELQPVKKRIAYYWRCVRRVRIDQSETTIAESSLFSVDEIGNSELVFGEMRPRIGHRLPDIRLTVGENLRKPEPVGKRLSRMSHAGGLTAILPVVLHGCETWTLTLTEEQMPLSVFENKALRKIFRAKRDEVILRRFIDILGYLASEGDEGDNARGTSPGSSTESYPAFAHIELRENPIKKPQTGNLSRPGIEPWPPGFAAKRASRYSTECGSMIGTYAILAHSASTLHRCRCRKEAAAAAAAAASNLPPDFVTV
ncbi:hypothetical protein ANN_22404 [Periplaneta americana]|uniref:Uncharacterized protein n=1 Tax=Periplaneta americana TaxID=6978 RepID=A0ABQ8S823_PERAM|nr:hypothetical protein ANN_22404 [Periplaneta americana]